MTNEPHHPLQRFEIAAVIVVTLLGAILRLAFLENIAVEHFDEGVYASSSNSYFWFVGDEYFHYPFRFLYAPPLVPVLIQTSIDVFGPSPLSVALVGLLAGIALVPLIWWVGRSWFGPATGMAAAILAGGSEFHIIYSRMALTDSLLGFFLLLAVYLLGEALRREHFLWAAAAGVATALAWWTKYNGWLPLAIGIAGTGGALLAARAPRWEWKKPILLLAMMAVVAVLLWSPFLASLEPYGGYATVASNHRQYVVGLAGWGESFQTQLANLGRLESWITPASIGLAWLAAILMNRFTCNAPMREPTAGTTLKYDDPIEMPRPIHREVAVRSGESLAILLAALTISGFALVFGSAFIMVGLAIIALSSRPVELLRKSGFSFAPVDWILLAWFVGMLLATPFYRPYPRLLLPFLIVTWIGAARGLGDRNSPGEQTARAVRRDYWIAIPLMIPWLIAISLGWMSEREEPQSGFFSPLPRKIPAYEPHTGLRTIARQVVADLAEQTGQPAPKDAPVPFILSVYGEPALFFHLGAEGAVVQPVADFSFLSSRQPPVAPLYLIAGPHAQRTPGFTEELKKRSRSLELVATYSYQPSTVILLNEYAPWKIPDDSTQEVRVYRMMSGEW